MTKLVFNNKQEALDYVASKIVDQEDVVKLQEEALDDYLQELLDTERDKHLNSFSYKWFNKEFNVTKDTIIKHMHEKYLYYGWIVSIKNGNISDANKRLESLCQEYLQISCTNGDTQYIIEL